MPAPTTVEQTRAPMPIRVLNKCGAALDGIVLRSAAPSANRLIERAKQRCRLEDFGGNEFVEPLARLLQSCHREARLNVIGKMALRSDVVRILCNRLLLARDRKSITRSEEHTSELQSRVDLVCRLLLEKKKKKKIENKSINNKRKTTKT